MEGQAQGAAPAAAPEPAEAKLTSCWRRRRRRWSRAHSRRGRLDSTFLTARRQRTGTTAGENTSPLTHRPDRPTRSHTHEIQHRNNASAA
eukprot:6978830-Prymnesium_polylepis.1